MCKSVCIYGSSTQAKKKCQAHLLDVSGDLAPKKKLAQTFNKQEVW